MSISPQNYDLEHHDLCKQRDVILRLHRLRLCFQWPVFAVRAFHFLSADASLPCVLNDCLDTYHTYRPQYACIAGFSSAVVFALSCFCIAWVVFILRLLVV